MYKLFPFAALFGLACTTNITGEPVAKTETAPDAGSDSDSESDAGNEPDGESDDNTEDDGEGDIENPDDSADEEPLGDPTGIEMTVVYETMLNGSIVCDTEVDVSGPAYTGDCPDCTFAFDISGVVSADESDDSCYASGLDTFAPSSWLVDLVFAHADELEVDNGESVETYTDAVFIRYFSDWSLYGMGVYGPYYHVITHTEGEEGGEFRRDGAEFVWNASADDTRNGEDLVIDYCDSEYTVVSAEEDMGGVSAGRSNLACSGSNVDMWSVSLASDQTLTVTVDTVADATAFDPRIYLLGDDECVVGMADDTFECSYPPPRFSCPSAQFEAAAGDWTIVVNAFPDSCADGVTEGEYELRFGSSGGAERPYLDENDLVRYEEVPFNLTHEASGQFLY